MKSDCAVHLLPNTLGIINKPRNLEYMKRWEASMAMLAFTTHLMWLVITFCFRPTRLYLAQPTYWASTTAPCGTNIPS